MTTPEQRVDYRHRHLFCVPYPTLIEGLSYDKYKLLGRNKRLSEPCLNSFSPFLTTDNMTDPMCTELPPYYPKHQLVRPFTAQG